MGASLSVCDAAFKTSDSQVDALLLGGACADGKGAGWHYSELDETYNELATRISNVEVQLWVILASALKYLARKNRNLFTRLVNKPQIAYAEKVERTCRSLLRQFQTHFAPVISAADVHARAENVEARVAHIQTTGEDDPSLMPSLKQCFVRRAREEAAEEASGREEAADRGKVVDLDAAVEPKLTRRRNAPENYVYISQDVCGIFFDLLWTARNDFLFLARTTNLVSNDVISLPYLPQSELVLLGSTLFIQTKMLLTRIASHLCLGQDAVDSYLRQAQARLAEVNRTLDELQGCAGCLQFDAVERQMIKARMCRLS